MPEAHSWPLLTSIVRKLRDTDVSLSMLSVSPLGLLNLGRKAMLCFKDSYRAL
jgi:hypothetical protein